jgi:peptidoglycan/LPS O-acetylase OafA/YrhL
VETPVALRLALPRVDLLARAGTGIREDVQGLRGIAVLLVVLYHAGGVIPNGFLGVDVFFAISGFVITRSLVGEFAATGHIALGAFYARRVRRLLPALAVMLVTVSLVGVLAAPFEAQRMTAATAVAAALLSANAYLMHLSTGYFAVQTAADPLLHTWTLGVEEQFYLVFPLLLIATLRTRRTAAVLMGVFAVSILSYDVFLAGVHSRFGFYGSPARAWEFGLGALTALALVALPRAASLVVGIVGLVLLDVAVFGDVHQRNLLAVLGTCAVIGAGASPVNRMLSNRALVAIGAVSYSWYLWHWPFIAYATALAPRQSWVPIAAAAASLVPAWLSYRFVERPFRRGLRPALPLAAGCAAVAVAAAGVLVVSHSLLARDVRFAQLAHASVLHADVTRGCDASAHLHYKPPCVWGSGTQTVALVGDSNAGHFTEPVVAADTRLGYRTLVATHSSCPFAAVTMWIDGSNGYGRSCRAWVDRTVGVLVRLRPRAVVIGTRADKYIGQDNIALGDATTPGAKQLAYAAGVSQIAGRLTRAGISVLLVQPVPKLGVVPDRCAAALVLLDRCVSRVSRADARAELARAAAAGASVRNVTLVDFFDALCGPAVCTGARYRDDEHLSVEGALSLEPGFERLIATRPARRPAASAR